MHLTLILGPMKSGKSYELISFFAPLKYSNVSFSLYQAAKHVREPNITSRNGSIIESKRINSLREIFGDPASTIGIDEFHMFPEDETWVIEKLLCEGKSIFISSLDTDYRGILFRGVAHLMALAPREVKFRRAVCEVCKVPDATQTQVFDHGKPLLGSLPSVLPEDGTFRYAPVCRKCFVRGESIDQKRLFI